MTLKELHFYCCKGLELQRKEQNFDYLIAIGTFIGEYIGQLISIEEATKPMTNKLREGIEK